MKRDGHDEPMTGQGFVNRKLSESLEVGTRGLAAVIVHDEGKSSSTDRIGVLNRVKR
jgi:hypothetical protein